MISLKKSLVKDQAGIPILPHQTGNSVSYQDLSLQNEKLQMELNILKKKHEELIMESSSSLETVNHLRNVIRERDETIKVLETSYQTARLTADKLNKALSDSRSKSEREKVALMKEQHSVVYVLSLLKTTFLTTFMVSNLTLLVLIAKVAVGTFWTPFQVFLTLVCQCLWFRTGYLLMFCQKLA